MCGWPSAPSRQEWPAWCSLGRRPTWRLGLAIGLAGGWLLSRFVQAFLFNLDAHDPIVYLSVAVLLVATGLIASFIPARRAARVDPVTALRS